MMCLSAARTLSEMYCTLSWTAALAPPIASFSAVMTSDSFSAHLRSLRTSGREGGARWSRALSYQFWYSPGLARSRVGFCPQFLLSTR